MESEWGALCSSGSLSPKSPSLASRQAQTQENRELLHRINKLGIGPAGFGGRTTCLGLHIELGPAHIAHFPVAINIDCHSHRGAEVTL